MLRLSVLAILVNGLLSSLLLAQSNPRDRKILADKEKVETDGYWIYNDLPRAFAEARQSGKPIVACLRCIPCVECVKLDDDLMNTDPQLKPLLDRFVRLRIVSTNGLDLSLFQFDTDQSFAVFLLNGDGTIYGRFGTRSHRSHWIGDVSLEGMAKALSAALEMHANFERVKASLQAKRGPQPLFSTPEQFPTLKGKYASSVNFQAANVGQTCIHCHQIGDALRSYYRQKGEPIPEEVLFPYPHPKILGIVLDPKEKAQVSEVEAGSWAEQAGFRSQDELLSLNGQPLISMADVQWVLQGIPASGGQLQAQIRRGGQTQTVTASLPPGWRRRGDISWRATTWGLRRMATGGLVLETVPAAKGEPTLRVQRVGAFGPHAAAQRAGFKQGDVILAWDGQRLNTEADVILHGVTRRKPGDIIPVTVLRSGSTIELKLPMQE